MESWPEHLRDANSAFVANEAHALAGRIDFYAWLQWIVDEQLQRARPKLRPLACLWASCMTWRWVLTRTGLDVWTTPEVFAAGVSVVPAGHVFAAGPELGLRRPLAPPAWRRQAMHRCATWYAQCCVTRVRCA